MKSVVLGLALAAVAIVALPAGAQPANPPAAGGATKVRAINCPAGEIVKRAFQNAEIKSCPISRGDPNRPAATDEFLVAADLPDGTSIEVVATRQGIVNIVKRVSPHGDRWESDASGSRPGLALLFWAFALASVGGALFVVTRRNLIAAVMGMVGSFIGIAAVYMMLYASFLSVIQMLVYAGAIMVLFVFVIMILNRPEDEPVAPSGRAGQLIGGAAILYLVGRLVMMLINVRPPDGSGAPPDPVVLPRISADQAVPQEAVDWGSVKAVGMDLFGPGLFPFEAISILLLVAVVGAIAIARPLHRAGEADTESPPGDEGGAA